MFQHQEILSGYNYVPTITLVAGAAFLPILWVASPASGPLLLVLFAAILVCLTVAFARRKTIRQTIPSIQTDRR